MKNWQPHDYQLRAVQHTLANPAAALFLEPGLGKTSITLAALTVLKEAGKLKNGALVVAPLRPAYSVWPSEIAKWADFNGLTYTVLHGPAKAERLAQKADLYIINYDGLAWLEKSLHPARRFDVLVLDESTKVKNGKTVRFKTLRAMANRFDRRMILTGTPAPRSLQDLWAPLFLLDGGARLETFITRFRRKYFDEIPSRYGYSEWLPRRNTAREIEDKIKDITLTLRAEDYLKMPACLTNVIGVELPAAAMSVYRELENEFYAEVAEGEVTAANAAAKGMKLRQIAGGGVYASMGVAYQHTAKVDALVDLIEEQEGQPLLVAVAFQHEVDAIRKALGYDAPYLGGGISPKASDAICADWNSGKIPVLLAHPASVAHGLNLQAGGHAVAWFTLTWNLEEYIQFNARVHRQGQEKTVVIHHIVADDTIDSHVSDLLVQKRAVQDGLLKSLSRS
jgi:SNF2 family DNA or RNA helicase